MPVEEQLPLPPLPTTPQVYGPEPTKVWFAIGSYDAPVWATLTFMTDAGKTQVNAQLIVVEGDPMVYCAG